MTLEQIKYFLAAADYQHVGRAAQAVSISPSAISAAIGALEEELNTKLFERRSKRIFLTPVGYELKAWGANLLKEVASVKFTIGQSQEELQGRYRLAASHFLATELLAPAWFDLQDKYPKLVGDLRSMDTGVLVGDVLSGRLDLGLVFSVVNHPEIELIKIHEGDLVIVVHKSHPILKKRVDIKTLSQYPSVTHKSAQGSEICEGHPIFPRLGIVPQTSVYFDSDEIALAKIKRSQAWALLPDFIAKKRPKDFEVVYRDKSGQTTYFIAAIKRRSAVVDSTLAKLIEQIKRRVAV